VAVGTKILLGASLVFAAIACSDPARESAAPNESSARSAATTESSPRAGSNETPGSADAGSPDSPTLEDVARASATELARQPNDIDWGGGDAANGQALYGMHCAVCHGGGGTGDGLAAAALNPKPRDFTDGRFYIDASANNRTGEDVDLARVIRNGPGAFGGSNAMQGWDGAFSDDEVRDLIAHIRTLSDSNGNGSRAHEG
jgi:mono/diheme cytochrome c family protein